MAVYISEKWLPSHADVTFAFRWRAPGGTVLLYSVHTKQRSWTSTWQRRSIPLDPARGGGQGVWQLDLFRVREWDGFYRDYVQLGWERRGEATAPSFSPTNTASDSERDRGLVLGSLVASRTFYLGADAGTPLPPAVCGRYWQVASVTRVSAYAKHASCRDPRVQPDLCVCM